jgi:mRNA interferase RelE/StbE
MKPGYRLVVPNAVAQLLRNMHPHLKRKVRSSLKLILDAPHAGKELKDELEGLRSYRVARFRIIYRVRKNIVEIVAVGPRERIYQETFMLLIKAQDKR